MTIDDTIEAFKAGRLEIDFPTMVLTQCKEGGEVYRGTGSISQTDDGELSFKLYVTSATDPHSNPVLRRLERARPGKIMGDEEFYDLEATTAGGRIWVARRIMVSFNSDSRFGIYMARGHLHRVEAEYEYPRAVHYLRLHFFEELEIPLQLMSQTERHGDIYYVLDRSEYQFDDIQLEARKREGSGQTILELTSESAFSDSFHLRVQESLQYITGVTVTARARVFGPPSHLKLELASPTMKSIRTRFHSPIGTVLSEYRTVGWELFAQYLRYVSSNTNGTHWNPVAYHLYNAREATANSIDAGAIGVCVTLEAIASLISFEADEDKTQIANDLRTFVSQQLSERPEFEPLKQRVEGILSGLSATRPQDVLHALAAQDRVEGGYVRSWSELRNRQVHPKLTDLERPDAVHYQSVMTNVAKVQVLIHQLIFHLIGYQGPFTDYGADGHPIKQYPMVRDAAACSP